MTTLESKPAGGGGMLERRIQVGPAELAIRLRPEQAAQLRNSAPYRRFVQPTLRRLLRPADSPQPAARAAVAAAAAVATPNAFAPPTPEADAVMDRIKGIEWYHTIELPHGVVTRGFTDHRFQVPMYGLPASLAGKRVLDVATNDGFWAFEMERRGADVVAIDIGSWADFDIPRAFRAQASAAGVEAQKTGAGFLAAHELLNSKVERHIQSVYTLTPERFGLFDVVFLSDLLLHLRDPQLALENLCSVVKPGGYAIIADVYQPQLDHFTPANVTQFGGFGEYVWWRPSVSTLTAMMGLAGFDEVEELGRFVLQATSEEPIHKVILRGWVQRPTEG